MLKAALPPEGVALDSLASNSSLSFAQAARISMCHAKSQFGLATQMGVCACYTTRSLTGGIGGF